MDTTIMEANATLSRLAFVNKAFRALASELGYQHLIFRNPSDLQTLVHSINTNQGIHAVLPTNLRTISVLLILLAL